MLSFLTWFTLRCVLLFVDHVSVASLRLCLWAPGRPISPLADPLLRHASILEPGFDLLPLHRMLRAVTELGGGGGDHIDVSLGVDLNAHVPAETFRVIERDPSPGATAAGEVGVELDVQIVVFGGEDDLHVVVGAHGLLSIRARRQICRGSKGSVGASALPGSSPPPAKFPDQHRNPGRLWIIAVAGSVIVRSTVANTSESCVGKAGTVAAGCAGGFTHKVHSAGPSVTGEHVPSSSGALSISHSSSNADLTSESAFAPSSSMQEGNMGLSLSSMAKSSRETPGMCRGRRRCWTSTMTSRPVRAAASCCARMRSSAFRGDMSPPPGAVVVELSRGGVQGFGA